MPAARPRYRLPGRKRPRHYTAKRGSDAAVIGAQVHTAPVISRSKHECRPDYGVKKRTQNHRIRASLKVRGLSILRTSFEFIRGHSGKVANKAPPGS